MGAFPGLASGVGSGVENVTFQSAADVLQRKLLLIGTFDPLKTSITAEVAVLITSPEDAGDKFGFGFPVHRLALKAELGAQGIETWVMPQAETGTVSDGEIDWAGTTGVVAGTLAVYISGERIPVTVTTAMTVEELSDAVVAAVNAVPETPVVAAKTATTFETTFTAKAKGLEGDNIDISLAIGVGESIPTGVAAAITVMTNGAGTSDIGDALDALGTGDNANEAFFTDMAHGYGQDSTTLATISTYVGAGNDFTGLYAKTVARPFRSLTGDVVAGSSGLAAQIVVADARRDDRSQGVVSVPGSQSHPVDIAAQTIGHMARINNIRAEEAFNNITLIGVLPGDTGDRWTSDYSDRDTAVRNGISPTLVDGGTVKLQNVVSFYRPASVPVSSNGYREMVNIAKLQNILNSQKINFQRDKWQNISIVADTAKVTNPISREKARDRDAVLDDLIQLINAWAGNAWIADAAFSIGRLKSDASLVAINGGGDGFTITIPVVLSGIGNIYDVTTQFDISFAAL
jgi:phage tail sheath gpL-like